MATAKKKQRKRKKTSPHPLLTIKAYLESGWLRFLLALLMGTALLGLDLFLSQDRLDHFAVLFGLELIMVLVVSWSLYLWSRSRRQQD